MGDVDEVEDADCMLQHSIYDRYLNSRSLMSLLDLFVFKC